MQPKSARNYWESLGFQTVYTHSFSLSLSLSNLSTPAPSNGTAPVKQGLNTNVSIVDESFHYHFYPLI